MIRTEYIGELNNLILRIANSLQVTFHTTRLARLADEPARPDQLMRENNPLLSWNEPDEMLLSFLRVGITGQIEASGHALHVSIDDNPRWNAKSCAQDNVGRLACHSGKRQ